MKIATATVVFALLVCFSSGADEDIDATYECDFEQDECGFVNLPHTNGRFERKRVDLGGRNGYVMIVESTGDEPVIASIQSPYFQIGRTLSMCLTYDVYMSGKKAGTKVTIETESNFNSNSNSISGKEIPWRTLRVGLTVDDNVKIMFQGSATNGKVAIDNFKLKVGSC